MTRARFEQLADEAGWPVNPSIRESAFRTIPEGVQEMSDGGEEVTRLFLSDAAPLAGIFSNLRDLTNAKIQTPTN